MWWAAEGEPAEEARFATRKEAAELYDRKVMSKAYTSVVVCELSSTTLASWVYGG
jgi:hypothetical protein